MVDENASILIDIIVEKVAHALGLGKTSIYKVIFLLTKKYYNKLTILLVCHQAVSSFVSLWIWTGDAGESR